MYVRRSQLVTCAHTSRSVIASSIDEKKRNKRREERGKITTRRSCPAPGDELMLLPLARSSCVSLSLAVYAPLVAIVSLGPSNDDAPRKRLSPESTFWSWRLDCQPSGSRFFSVGPSTLYCLSLSLSLCRLFLSLQHAWPRQFPWFRLRFVAVVWFVFATLWLAIEISVLRVRGIGREDRLLLVESRNSHRRQAIL